MKTKIGGRLQGISLDAFLQMSQMEQITCTLSVVSGDRSGTLFLQKGNLVSAEANGLNPLEAAHHIISWEKAAIEITETCDKTVDDIKQPLMNILMEAMRLRDEAANDPLPEKKSASPPEKTTPDPDIRTGAENQPKRQAQTGSSKRNIAPAVTPGRLKRLPWKYIAAVLVFLLIVAGITGRFLTTSKRKRLAYESLITAVDAADTTEEKLRLLNVYTAENPAGKYEAGVKRRIESLREQKAAKGFEDVKLAASRFTEEGDIDAAIAVYEAYLDKTPGSRYRSQVQTAVKTLSDRLEDIAFKEMQATALSQGPERLATYLTFLESHSDTGHRQEILDLISSMENEYFVYVEQQMREYEASKNWAECIELSQNFLNLYPESDHAETITKWLVNYREEFQSDRIFKQLQTRSERLGEDYETALTVYTDYLEAHPGSPVKGKIEREIERLAELVEKRRLAESAALLTRKLTESGDRFVAGDGGTVRDKKTGLVWCLLDSRTILNRCVTYEEATAWVASLKTGGYDDWRLPTPKELSTLFKKPQPFPTNPSQWYWSSRNRKQYTGIWVIDVEVVEPGQAGGVDMSIKKSWQCGAVRAVRRP